MRILLIEDDTMIGKAVRRGLADAGFAIDWVTDGRAAELALDNAVYDLAVLDLGLPKNDGMAILATLRGKGNAIPVLIASARDTVRDRIAGLEAGAATTCSNRSTWTNWWHGCAPSRGAMPAAGRRSCGSEHSCSTRCASR